MMPNELIFKKIEQIGELVTELERLLDIPFETFRRDLKHIRATERNFQLTVDLASDINTQLLLEQNRKTPDTYRQSFTDLETIGAINRDLAKKLALSASLRNILVHEYDFEEDYEKFYNSAKNFIPLYREYLKAVYKYIKARD
jgi:uncharacterized protein YutE (UPF0331/DUF86 family)